MKRGLLVLAALALFAAAILGLLLVDDRAPAPAASKPASRPGPPPDDHIDDSSREALLEILREESGE